MDKSLESRLQQADQNFHQWCDQVNRLWVEAEAKVLAINPGRPVVTIIKVDEPADEDPPGSVAAVHLLGLFKIQGNWRLGYGLGPEEVEYWEHPYSWKPITECSLEQRLEAAKALESLMKNLIEAREERTSKAEVAAGALAEALSRLRRF
jgi:hypothetical protein